MVLETFTSTVESGWCRPAVTWGPLNWCRNVRCGLTDSALRIGVVTLILLLLVAIEPAAAQGNPVCSEESGTLVNMIEGFIQITTALGLMGLLVVWQADELANMFTIDQKKALALKQHKRGAMKSAAILVLLGPLFTIAGSAMNLPIAQCVDLTPF